MADTVKKTIRKLPSKIYAFAGFTKDGDKVIMNDKLEIFADLDSVLVKLQDPEYMVNHKMYTLTHDDLYI